MRSSSLPIPPLPARIAAAVAVLAAGAAPLHGQYRSAPRPAAWAVENAVLLTVDGLRTEGVDLVVRGGLVEALGPDVAIPEDARVLEGEGLTVMAGLVDAQGHAEVEWPDTPDGDEVTAWDPPRWRQGFTPHRKMALHLERSDDTMEDRRREGVVASLAHPSGGFAPGQGAVLVHRARAETPWERVDGDTPGPTFSFRGAGGVYPSQLFGVIAFLRQAFLDAARYGELREAWRTDPTGMTAPSWDPDFEVLLRATAEEVPVFFQADSDEDIRRVLSLADEFGFRPVILGGDEAWKLAGELAEREVPVLASLDFPRPDAWDPEADTVAGGLAPDAVREKERLEDVWSNAGRLEAAGVRLALTSGGGMAEMLEGARKAVEYGLSPEGALRAMTTEPASLLGLAGYGDPAPGRPATLVIFDGDPLEEETRVAYTFVEGALTRGPGAPGEEAEEEREPPAADLSGEWEGEFGGPQGAARPFSLTLEQTEDGELTGTVGTEGMPPSEISGSVSGSSVTLRIEAAQIPEPIVLTGTVDPSGDRIEGGGTSPFGPLEFALDRAPGDRGADAGPLGARTGEAS
jgi:hypothetical protein